MVSTFIDLSSAGRNGDVPPPRGLLPVPPEVEQDVAREVARIEGEHGFTLTSEAKQRMTNSLTLQHYYENQTIAYRQTPQGVEVLAVGDQEIGELVRRRGTEDRRDFTVGQV
jgi:hypothetical protein